MHAEIKITPTGDLVFIYEDELQPLLALGQASVKRASHVEPVPSGDQAGQWTVNLQPLCSRFGLPAALVAGKTLLGPFPTRHSALFAEKSTIERLLFEVQA